MSAPNLKVVDLYTSNFRQPAATLREIADRIDNGDFGEVGCVAVALMGERVEIFGAGIDSGAPSVALLFHAAFLRMSRAIEEHGRT